MAWLIGLAVVVSLAVLFLKAPAPRPVSLRFLGSTNHEGMRRCSLKEGAACRGR